MGQIRVTGTGRLKVKPDTTRLVMTLSGTYKDYEDAMKHSADDTEDVKKSIMKFGIGKEDIKTVTFSVDASYENYNKKGEYDRHFVGYEYNHVLKVEFANNNELLGKILYALAHSDTDPEISIRYTVKDPELEKTKLLGDALRDAERKAEAAVILGMLIFHHKTRKWKFRILVPVSVVLWAGVEVNRGGLNGILLMIMEAISMAAVLLVTLI